MYCFLTLRGFVPFLLILFLGSFIELGHKIIVLSTIYQTFEDNQRFILGGIQNILILLPAVLLFVPAGFLAKTYPKSKLIRISAWLSLTLSLVIVFCYSLGLFWIAFSLGFVLSVQSALFFPSTMSYLKEILTPEKITQAQSLIQGAVITAMLSALLLFGTLFQIFASINPLEALTSVSFIGVIFVILSCIQIALSYLLPNSSTPSPTSQHNLSKPAQPYLQNLKQFLHNILILPNLSIPIFATILFWSIAQLCITLFPYYAQTSNTEFLSFIALCLGGGMITGSFFAFSLSKNYLELGIIPFGFLSVLIALGGLSLSPSLFISLFLAFLLGLGGALILIPCISLIFRESLHLSQTLAFLKLTQSLGMIASIVLVLLCILTQIQALWIFRIAFLFALFGFIYCLYRQPSWLVRFLLTLAFNQRYRLIVEGFVNIPQNKGVLLLGNHISFIDWAIVQMAIPQKVYFAIEHNLRSKWFIKLFLNHSAIIKHTSSTHLLSQMKALLEQNQIVCFFPEGAVSTHGHLNAFKKDYTDACASNAVIVPFYIRGLWGSNFSRSNENFKAKSYSLLAKRNITIAFGEQLPINTPTEKVKNIVFDLSFVAWKSQCHTMSTLGREWINTAKSHLFQTSIIDPIGGRFSFGKVLALSLLLSSKIRKTKTSIKQGEFAPQKECIGILLPASFASSLCNLSILLASRVAVNLNFTSGIQSLQFAIQSAQIARIFTSKTFLNKLKEKGINLEFENIQMVYMEDLIAEIKTHKSKLIGYLAMAFLLPRFVLKKLFSPEKNTQDVACILFSSGSEGIPKGIMLNHNNITSNIAQISDVLCVQDSDAILSSLPPFHAFGLTATTFLPLFSGIPSITYPDPTDAQGIAQTIAKHKATIMCGTSTFLGLYARNPKVDRLMFSSLRIVVSGAEKLKDEIRTAFENKFQRTILEGYGATETTPVVSVNLPCQFDYFNDEIHKANKIGSVGMPLPGTTLKIVDPQTMQPLPHGESGLILVGGHQVMVGYLNNPIKTHEVTVELNGMRWYKTGDKGFLDQDGFLYILDRYSRFAKIGGEMVSLGGIEEEITKLTHKDEKWQECKYIATALEDSKKGEMVVLLIQAPSFEIFTQLMELIKHSNLPAITKPKHYFYVEHIPLLGSGKVDLATAKEMAKKLVNH